MAISPSSSTISSRAAAKSSYGPVPTQVQVSTSGYGIAGSAHGLNAADYGESAWAQLVAALDRKADSGQADRAATKEKKKENKAKSKKI